MRRILFFSILAAMFLALAGYTVFWFTTKQYIEVTNNAFIEADIAVIAPKVAGYVREVRVADNQIVRRGEALVIIDDSDFRVAHDRADAEVARQKSAVTTANATSGAQTSTIAAAEAAVQSARAEAIRAEADRQRYQALLAKNWVTRSVFEAKAAEAASRTAAVAQASAMLAAARASGAAINASEGGVQASRRGALAALAATDLDLANTVVRAPLDGTIGNRSVRVGQYIKPGQQLMVAVPLAQVYVVANFKETQIGRMRIGQPVTIKVDAYDGQSVPGHILSISPASGSRFSILPPENATGNFTKIVQRVPIKIALDRRPAELRLVPGMSVEVSIDVRSEPHK